MNQIKRERIVPCPLEGLEMVTVTYNLRATAKQVDRFRATLLSKDAAPLVVTITGWPEKCEPLGLDAPNDFRYWVGYGGWQAAIRMLLDDPLFSMPPSSGIPTTTPDA